MNSKEETKDIAVKVSPPKKPEEVKTEEVKAYPSIYAKLQNARAQLASVKIKKGGRNKFSDYDYFELPDFLPEANKILNDNRITPVFNPYPEYAEIILYDFDTDKTITFRTETADATVYNSKTGKPSNLAIQTLGSTHTYLKRYLYMNLLEIAENDAIDPTTGNPELRPRDKQLPPTNKPEVIIEKASLTDVEEIEKLFSKERIDKYLDFYKVKELKEIPKVEAGKMIEGERLAKEKALTDAKKAKEAVKKEGDSIDAL